MICRSSFAQSRSCTHVCNTCVSSYRDENPVCCSCVVLYVGSRGAEPPAGPAAEQHEEQLGQGGTPGLACPAGDVSNLGTQVCAAARTTGGSEEQRSTGAQGTSTRKKTCCNTHTEVRIRADTNGTVQASAWNPLSPRTGHAVHFTSGTTTSRASHEQGKELLSS